MKITMQSEMLTVISHYAGRDIQQLSTLLSQVQRITKNILIVVNDDQAVEETEAFFMGFPVILRPNFGMNIGAWNAAFEKFPMYKFYIFLQDECSLIRNDFLVAYEKELSRNDIGMTGESINYKWDKPWSEMLKSPLNYQVSKNLHRVEYYLHLMGKWKINPGLTGRHLRSLVWGFNNNALSQLGGFPIGSSKEECIAAEIAVSKKIEELGLKVTQISDVSFSYFSHGEWLADGTKKK
jgi:hypothetical protein